MRNVVGEVFRWLLKPFSCRRKELFVHYLSYFTRVSQWYHAFLLHVELACPLWDEAISLLRDITASGRACGAAISLCMERTACLS